MKSSAGRCPYWPPSQRLAWLGTWMPRRLSDSPQVDQSHPVLYSIQHFPLRCTPGQGNVVWGCWGQTVGHTWVTINARTHGLATSGDTSRGVFRTQRYTRLVYHALVVLLSSLWELRRSAHKAENLSTSFATCLAIMDLRFAFAITTYFLGFLGS